VVSISGVGLPSGTIEDAIFGRVSELEKMGAIFVVGTREANRTLVRAGILRLERSTVPSPA